MQRASPRKRKQVFPQGSPPESPSKADMTERRNLRQNPPPVRSWDEQQMMKDGNHELFKQAGQEEDKLDVDHVEEVVEEMEEEEVEVDDPAEEEVVEEYVVDDGFDPNLFEDNTHIIHTSGRPGGPRRYGGGREYAGGPSAGNFPAVPRIHDGNAQFGGQMKRQMKYREGMGVPGPVARPPVHLRTADGVTQQPRARLLPVAIARPSVHHRYGQGYGGLSSAGHWREDQQRKIELLDIYESLPVDKQMSFLKYLNSNGDSFIPPTGLKGRRSGEAGVPTITRMRAHPNEMAHRQHTVEVPAQFAKGGAEILISPMPDGRNRIMSLIPVGEEEGRKTGEGPKLKKRKEEGEEGEARGEGEVEDETDTSDMPLLEPDKEALEKRKEGRREGEWNGMEEDVDVENVEDAERRMEEESDEDDEGDDTFPMLHNENRGNRRGLFYVPELDGYPYDQRYSMCAPKMKGGLRLCESCNIYMRKSVFYHHQRTIREHGSCSAMTPKRFECGVPECDEKLPTIERLCIHMAEMHNMPTDVQETEFQTEDEFQAFLVELESKGGNFRMSRGNKQGRTGIVRYYRCNRVSNKESRGRPRKSIPGMDQSMDEGVEGVEGALIEMEERDKEGGDARRRKQALVRTEKICTAFYRKAESAIDGRISVRYCDFHLHEDVKVKLPESVKNRIMEMLTKKLPMPVIVEVIKAESEEFARLGSELEKRIYSIGEKDVRNVYCTYLARRRKEEPRGSHADEIIPDLNENEAKFLMAFERAEGKSIHEVAKGSKVTLERRRRRDQLRERASNIQLFFRSEQFVSFSDAQLSKLESQFKSLDAVVKTAVGEQQKLIDEEEMLMEEDIEEEEGERAVEEMERNGGEEREEGGVREEQEGAEGGEPEDNQPSTSTPAVPGETPAVRKRGRPRKIPLTVEEALRLEMEKEKRAAEREKEKEEMDEVAKEEEDLEADLVRTPVVTSRGRTTKPKKFDDY